MTESVAEVVLIFHAQDLPEIVTGRIAADHPIRECLFYVSRDGSPAIQSLFEDMPEPPFEDTEMWMNVAEVALSSLSRGGFLGILGSGDESIHGYGFHTGEAAHVRKTLMAAGAVLVDAGRDLAMLRWFTRPNLARPTFVRSVCGPSITIELLQPVVISRDPLASALFAVPVSTAERRIWAVVAEYGCVEIDRAFLNGVELIVASRAPRNFPPATDPRHLGQAVSILQEVFGGTWHRSYPTTTVRFDELGGVANVEVTHDLHDGNYMTDAGPIDVLPYGATRFDAVRYRALATAVRGHLEREGLEFLPEELVPLLLLDDANLRTVEDFAAALLDGPRAAALVALRVESTWRALGITGPMGAAHGVLSIAWHDLAPYIMLLPDELVALQEGLLAMLDEVDRCELVRAASAEYRRWLLSDDVDPVLAPIVLACLEALDRVNNPPPTATKAEACDVERGVQ